ncbi:MAG: addiction module protein [Nitrospira sp.]|nr:addiction module protein [Nitrospira sp.]MDE0504616.1 addiction module protein [Candidatus Poribacteria bacterium]
MMSRTFQEVERDAVHLPAKDREILAERLIRSLKNEPLTEVEEAWVKEAERRFSAWRKGSRAGVPQKQAFKRIRKELGW